MDEKKENLTRQINFRLTEEESEKIKCEARELNIAVSDLIRKKVTGRKVVSKTDVSTAKELRRLGGLVKLIHNETMGRYYSKETADILVKISRVLERI